MKALIPLGSLPSHELHCIFNPGFMTALSLSASQQNSGSTAVKQRGPETLMKQLLSAYLDPELWEEGSTTQGLTCMFGFSVWCCRGGGGLSHGRDALPEVLLLQWKRLWSKVSKDEL